MVGMSSKAADLKAAIDESLNQLARAVDEQRASDEMRRYLDLMARFHKYSFGNCLLIAMARPDATMVAGFGQWKRLGRAVKHGEKAIRIVAPCPVSWEDPETGDEEERLFFKTACVFDVLQTQGKDLPRLEIPDVQAAAEGLLRSLERVATKRGITVSYAVLGDGAYGLSKGGHVEIAAGYTTGQQAKTLAHEVAHERLHRRGDGQVDTQVSRQIRELEAEAVAYVVCRHFSLDVELRASRYIAAWGGDAKALGASLSRISNMAKKLIEDVQTEHTADEPAAMRVAAMQPEYASPAPCEAEASPAVSKT